MFKVPSYPNITLKFSRNMLISFYTHLGFKKSFLHQAFRKAVLGFHCNISIINPAFTLSNLRYATKFLFNLLLKNNKVVFICYYVPKALLKPLLTFSGNYYIYNKWPAGLLTNSYTTLESEILKLPYNYYPCPANAAVIINSDPDKAGLVSNEANKTLIPCFCFSDSVFDLDVYSYWVPTNTKSGYSKSFYLLYMESLAKKVHLIKKKLFLKSLRIDFVAKVKKHWARLKWHLRRRKRLKQRRKTRNIRKQPKRIRLKKINKKLKKTRVTTLKPKFVYRDKFRIIKRGYRKIISILWGWGKKNKLKYKWRK